MGEMPKSQEILNVLKESIPRLMTKSSACSDNKEASLTLPSVSMIPSPRHIAHPNLRSKSSFWQIF
jgi:hypothetical protein